MFNSLVRFLFGIPKNSSKSATPTSCTTMSSRPRQTPTPFASPASDMASVSRKVAETASPRETEVKFLDPPVEGGVMYVLASRGHRIYTVDLNKLTCDCPQFSSTKRGMAPNQVQKYCTHLFRQARRKDFCKSPFPNHELVSEYFDHLEHSGFAIGDKFFLFKIAHNDVFVVQKAYTSWVDVLTRKKTAKDSTVCGGEIERYGYNAPTNRWSYGDAPFNPMQC